AVGSIPTALHHDVAPVACKHPQPTHRPCHESQGTRGQSLPQFPKTAPRPPQLAPNVGPDRYAPAAPGRPGFFMRPSGTPRIASLAASTATADPRPGRSAAGSAVPRPSASAPKGTARPGSHRRRNGPDEPPGALEGVGVVDPFPAVAESEHGPSAW